MTTITEGQQVRLKPNRARAYGFDPSIVYTVASVYQRPDYVALWARLAELPTPANCVKASELRSA